MDSRFKYDALTAEFAGTRWRAPDGSEVDAVKFAPRFPTGEVFVAYEPGGRCGPWEEFLESHVRLS